MDDMKELIDEGLVNQVILALGIVGPVLGLVLGGLFARVKGRPAVYGLLRGLGLGLLGTLVWGLWRLFEWLVRYEPAADPKDDYFGLERVDVLLLNVVLFAAVGALVGWVFRLVRERDAARFGAAAEPPAATPNAAENPPAEPDAAAPGS